MMGLCKSGEILGIFHQLDPNFQTLRHEETHPEYLLQDHIILWSHTIVVIMMVYTPGFGHHHHYVGYNGLRIITAMAMLMLMMILV